MNVSFPTTTCSPTFQNTKHVVQILLYNKYTMLKVFRICKTYSHDIVEMILKLALTDYAPITQSLNHIGGVMHASSEVDRGFMGSNQRL